MKKALCFSFWATLLMMTQGAFGQPTTNIWTGADPSGYWSAPANWSPAGVPVNGNELVFPGGLLPEDLVSTNDLTGGTFRSIRFGQGSRHTISGNPITLTNRADCIINSGTNVIACDLTFSGTPPTPEYQYPTIRDSFGSGELTVIGNVGGGSVYFFRQQFGTQSRWVIRGQFTGGSLEVGYSTLALYGDNPHAISAEVDHSTLLVQGSQPNLNIRMFSIPPKTLLSSSLRGEGQVGDVTGGTSYLILDSTLAARNVSVTYLSIILNGTNVGQYGRLVASGNVSAYSGFLNASAGFHPQEGQVYTIVEKTSPGPVTSAFFGPEGTVTTLNGMPFRISYVGGDGNDVTLTAMAPPPTVTVVGSDATASESGDSGMYTITRTGSTASSLTINYTLSGTAQNGTDYNSLSGSVTIPAGANSATVSVVPMDDTALEGNETVTLTLAANNAYTIGSPDGATVTIVDNEHPPTMTWTGADPSGYWSAPANWSPAGVPVNGTELVFPGGLPPGDMVSTNDLTGGIFRSIRFLQASRHTISGNPITLTNRGNVIIHSGTNVIACDLTLSGTPPTPEHQYPTITGSDSAQAELTVIGNVGGGSLYVYGWRVVIRGQFTGGSLRVNYGTLALYGDNPNTVSADVDHSDLLVQGSQPNLNIRMSSYPPKTLISSSLSGEGQVGDVTGGTSYLILDSTLAARNVSVTYLYIFLNGTNVGQYGRLVASGNVSAFRGYLFPSAGFNPQEGQVYTIVEKTSPGPVTSAFFGPEGTVTNLNGMPFRLSYVGGDGNDVTLTATDTSPTVTITNPPNGALFDAPASFTLGASAADPGGSVTNVQFFLGATSLGNDTSSPYSVPVSDLAVGNYTLTAVASDDAGKHATNSIAITVQPNAPPMVTITNPPNGALFDAPASFTLGAAAADPAGSVTNVQFFLDATSLGNDTSSPYSVPVSDLAVGNYTLTAVASDHSGAQATHSIAITVQPNTPPTVTITNPPNGAVFNAPASFTLGAAAADPAGSVTNVQFFRDATSLGNDTTSPYGVQVSGLVAGSYTLTAVASDHSGAHATNSIAITVQANTPPTVTITNPPNGAVFTAPASFTLGAAAADPGGSVTNVQFLRDGTSLGNDTTSPYSVPVSGLAAGNYTLRAVASDNNGVRATNSIAITVQPGTVPTVSIISPTNGAILAAPFGGTIRATATDSDGTIARVDFFSAAGATLGSVSNAPFNVVVTNIGAGTHSLFAVATDNGGATNRSATVTVTVVNPVPIVLSDIQRSFGTQSVFSYSANVGLSYRVERSATGGNWTAIRSNIANVNPMTVTDFATNRMNFYRIMRFPNP